MILTHLSPNFLCFGPEFGCCFAIHHCPICVLKKSELLRFDYAVLMYHMSWGYHVVMTSLVPDYSTIFHTTSHSDSYYYRD
jgi:hypothetical protein